jgi:signal transduction histidine kinase
VFPVELYGGTFELAGRKALIAAIRDISERNQAEEELGRYRRHLEDLVQERTAELTEANELLVRQIEERKKAQQALLKSRETLRKSERDLRVLTSQLFSIQEAERRRISKELHDGLGQELTVFKMVLNSLQKKLRQDQQPLKDECKFLLEYVDKSIENTRRLCKDLGPLLLEELGLAASLEIMFKEVCTTSNVTGNLEIEAMDHSFPRRTLVAIYRILQEALTNSAKHSMATELSLSVTKEAGKLNFVVMDNGMGFDLRSVNARRASQRGMGLFAMAERARMLGASLAIQSEAGAGTKVSFSIPV